MALALNPGASEDILRAATQSLGVELPFDYRKFLQTSNGGEGFLGQNYLQLWRAEDLKPRNDGYEVARFAPGFLLIGSNGGGEAFAFDVTERPWKVVQVPFMDLGDPRYTTELARSFTAFLEKIAR